MHTEACQRGIISKPKNNLLASHPVVATMSCAKVTLTETVTIPAGSEMEIRTCVHSNVKGIWLVEGDKTNQLPVCVARALMTNQNETVPLRVVNKSLMPITLYSNSKVAIAKQINEFTICSAVEGEELTSTEGIPHKCELLLAQPLPEDTTEAQKEQFMALFLHYSDVIAGNPEDLG